MSRKSVSAVVPKACATGEVLDEEVTARAILDTYGDHIANALREECFSGKFDVRIQITDSVRYVNQREREGIPVELSPTIEEQIHQLLCPCCKCKKEPVLLLTAGEGVGKTTLLRYVWDFYMPTMTAAQSENIAEHVQYVKEAFLFYVNVRWQSTAMLDDFYDNMQAQIIKKQKCAPPLAGSTARAFVRAQIKVIAANRPVLVICDNSDQLSSDTRQALFGEILSWVELCHGGMLKIVLPLRPETYYQRALQWFEPVPKNVIRLDDVCDHALMTQRGNEVKDAVESSDMPTQVAFKKGKDIVWECISEHLAAQYIRVMMQSLPDPAPATRSLLDNYCDGSNRVRLRLRHRLMRSVAGGMAIDEVLKKAKNVEWSKMSNYDYLEGIISGGGMPYHDVGHDDVDIPNLFVAGALDSNDDDSYSLMCGPFIAQYLKKHSNNIETGIDIDELTEKFVGIGFKKEEVAQTFKYLQRFNLVHVYKTGESSRVFWSRRRIEGLLEMLVSAAYIDIMAMVTPVGDDELAGMVLTKVIPSDFPKRTKTTLRFMRQFVEDEMVVLQAGERSRIKTNAARMRFNGSLPGLGLYTASDVHISRQAIMNYHERLNTVRGMAKIAAKITRADDAEINELTSKIHGWPTSGMRS